VKYRREIACLFIMAGFSLRRYMYALTFGVIALFTVRDKFKKA
jgi:hypothetical protein